MTLRSNSPKGRYWESESLPQITGLAAGSYTNPSLSVDVYGRITSITSGSSTGFTARNAGTNVTGGPFNTLNFVNGNITAANGGSGILNISVSGLANINVVDDGTLLSGGPFNTLNFSGTRITTTNAGSGQADIHIDVPTSDKVVRYFKSPAGTQATQALGTIPTTAIIRSVTVTVNTPYSAGATLQVEDGAGNILLPLARVDAEVSGGYSFDTPLNETAVANTSIVLKVNGNPGTGSCLVEVIFLDPMPYADMPVYPPEYLIKSINSSTYTLTAGDARHHIIVETGCDITIPVDTIPAGTVVTFQQGSDSDVYFLAGDGMIIDTRSTSKTNSRHSFVSILFLASNRAILVSEMAISSFNNDFSSDFA